MAGKNLIIRVRTKKGMSRLQTLNGSSTLTDLKKAISISTEIEIPCLKILRGYPPVVVSSSNEDVTLTSLSFQDGELLTVEEVSEKTHTSPVLASSSNKLNSSETKVLSSDTLLSQEISESTSQLREKMSSTAMPKLKNGEMLRKIVPANNSCLFTSIHYVMENGTLNLDCQKSMRDLIAKTVKNDPVTFNEAILGKKNDDYCSWIRNSSSWGGCIELFVLSKYYKKEICVADIRTGRIDRFGEDQNYLTRVFIIYDGIHFDPLHLKTNCNEVQTVFSSQDDVVMIQAADLANEAKKSKQFTNVENFKLRCLVCQTPLAGQVAAQEHAEKTGHINFGEIDS